MLDVYLGLKSLTISKIWLLSLCVDMSGFIPQHSVCEPCQEWKLCSSLVT